MRILIACGSKRGGTTGIGEMLGDALTATGADVVTVAARNAPPPTGFDAVIVGGAVYANRWHRDARRYIDEHERELRTIPTWLFSSGPLDHSADDGHLAATRDVAALGRRIGALGHTTFGGRLDAHATGFPAAQMAKTHAGDWRDPAQIRTWAEAIARALPTAKPAPAVVLPGRSPVRVVEYGIVGWALCALTMTALLAIAPLGLAIAVHAVAAPLWFALLSARYHRADGARSAAGTAAAWTVIVAALDAVVVAGAVQHSVVLLTSVAGFWLPLALIFVASWLAGALTEMRPAPALAPSA